MKQLVLLAAVGLSLAACNKQREPEDTTATITIDTSPQPAEAVEAVADLNESVENTSEADAAAEEADMQEAQEQADKEEEERFLEILNPNATNDLYVMRDKATGCEFIQAENDSYTSGGGRSMAFVPRPNGKGGQRGCGTGTDFVKAKRKDA